MADNRIEKETAPQQGGELKRAYSKVQIMLARTGLIAIAFVIVALLANVFTGGSERVTLALLFCLIVVPCIFYAFNLYIRKTVKKLDEKRRNDRRETQAKS